jgi:hypothetical protein
MDKSNSEVELDHKLLSSPTNDTTPEPEVELKGPRGNWGVLLLTFSIY